MVLNIRYRSIRDCTIDSFRPKLLLLLVGQTLSLFVTKHVVNHYVAINHLNDFKPSEQVFNKLNDLLHISSYCVRKGISKHAVTAILLLYADMSIDLPHSCESLNMGAICSNATIKLSPSESIGE